MRILLSTTAVALVMMALPTGVGSAAQRTVGQPGGRRNAGLIAHIEHEGLSFSISIDDETKGIIKIVVPEKQSFPGGSISPRPLVRLSVHMRDESIVEGVASETPPWVANGGSVDVTYQFQLRRSASVDDLFSVTIWIGDQRYTAFCF